MRFLRAPLAAVPALAIALTGLSWPSWNAGSAIGKGTWHINGCVPSCAQGHFLTYTLTHDLPE
jgi:hypothetical protein